MKSSLQSAFTPITEAVLSLVDTFAQTISGLAQTVAPLLSNVLGSVSKVVAGMLGGVDLSGLLTPLTAGLDGILGLFSKLGQATGTWMQGLDLSGLAGSFAGLAAAIGPVVKPFADAVQQMCIRDREMAEEGRAAAATGQKALELLEKADRKTKEVLTWVFGEENDFDRLLGGVNLMAVAANGGRVVTNLFAALQPQVQAGAEAFLSARAAHLAAAADAQMCIRDRS